MELLQLRYFYESAVNESFSKTAKDHMVPITSVSACIKRLEQELGCSLFARSSNRVRLSAEGKRFYESIREMFSDLDRAVASLKPQREEIPVRLLVADMRPVITDLMIRYRELNPTASFYMTMNRRNMDPEGYDIIIDEESDCYPGWTAVPLQEFRLRFCCSERNPIGNRRVTLRDLANEDFVGYEEDDNMYRRMLKACKEAGFEPRIIAMCNDVQCYLQLLAAGVGVTLLKDGPMPAKGIRYLDVADFDQTMRFMVYHRPELNNEKANAFVEFLREQFAKNKTAQVYGADADTLL